MISQVLRQLKVVSSQKRFRVLKGTVRDSLLVILSDNDDSISGAGRITSIDPLLIVSTGQEIPIDFGAKVQEALSLVIVATVRFPPGVMLKEVRS